MTLLLNSEPPFPARDPQFRQCTMPFDIEQYRGHDPETRNPLTDKQFIQQLIADLLGGLPDDIESCHRCMSSLVNRMSIVKVICLGCGLSALEAQIFEVSCLRARGRIFSVGYIDTKSGKPTFKKPTLKQLRAMKLMIAPAIGRFVGWLQNGLMLAVVARQCYMAAEPTASAAMTARPIDAKKPLTDKQFCVFQILAHCESRKGLTGKEIIAAAKNMGEIIEQSYLTSNIIPALKDKGICIQNERGAGYYLANADQHAEWKASLAQKQPPQQIGNGAATR